MYSLIAKVVATEELKKLLVKSLKPILWIGTLCLFLILYPPVSYALQIQDIPNPRQQYGGWVTDMANILSPEAEVQLNTMISNLEAKNSTEIAVVTVLETQPATSPKAFATELFNTWGIGKKNKNNGVLFLISTRDRRVEIERGSGLQKSLSDRKIQQIIETDIIPRFQQGDPEAGILKGTENLVTTLAEISHTNLSHPQSNSHQNNLPAVPGYIWIVGSLGWVGFIGFGGRLFLLSRHPRILGVKPPDGRSRFSAIEHSQSQSLSQPSEVPSLGQWLLVISFVNLIFALFYSLGWQIVKEHQAGRLDSAIVLGEAIWLCLLYFLPYRQAKIFSLFFTIVTAVVFFPFPLVCGAMALASISGAICINIFRDRKEIGSSLWVLTGMTVLAIVMFFSLGAIDASLENASLLPTASVPFALQLFAVQNARAFWGIIPIIQQLGKRFSFRPTYQCDRCHKLMKPIPKNKLSTYLTPAEQVAAKLGSVTFEGWLCSKCQPHLSPPGIYLQSYIQDQHSSFAFKNSFDNCSNCQELTVVRSSSKVLQEPTWTQAGKCGVRQECHCCGYTNDIQETIPPLELPKNALLILPQGRSHGVAEQKHCPVHCANCRNPMTAIRGKQLRPYLILGDLVRSKSGSPATSQSHKTERIGWYCATCYPELTETTIHIRTYTSSTGSRAKSSRSAVESDVSVADSEESWSTDFGDSYSSSESSSSWSSESSSSWGSDSGGSYSSGSDFGGGMSDGGGGGGSW
ncbi:MULTISPECIES: TPM domain-containing protein [Nostocales]|uniref:TPM domain-containing protein n=2 Tax=Nostocales TaxID=1161 RepID=A0ABW8WUH5_9CYAN|nr:TPM domain-containing protein [Tolypothrix bouteillei]